ncbi:hypothetical protein EV421DRAFT_1908789 [Armillaria borealis]|uniref:Uncharacterized protein n=1 Tax=Armillaria borealis TaxID=47425 RepID=A0AA39J489_9AGAR|nr:hypothetical protein EV421DRAFT_1908789 [Armillaria borealis]
MEDGLFGFHFLQSHTLFHDSPTIPETALFDRAPRLETSMLLDWRGSHQNLDHITPTDRYEVRRALVPKNTKVDTADTIPALDWTRRMPDTGTRLEEVVLIARASSVVDDKGAREA